MRFGSAHTLSRLCRSHRADTPTSSIWSYPWSVSCVVRDRCRRTTRWVIEDVSEEEGAAFLAAVDS